VQLNWKKGLLRIWLVISVAWVVLCAVIARPDQGLATLLGGELGVHLPDGTELVFPLAIERDVLEKAVVTLLIDQPSLLASTPKDLLAPDPEAEARQRLAGETAREFFDSRRDHGRKARRHLLGFGLTAIGFPAVLLMMGYVIAWIINGFDSRKQLHGTSD
jgi:hypothetical protein